MQSHTFVSDEPVIYKYCGNPTLILEQTLTPKEAITKKVPALLAAAHWNCYMATVLLLEQGADVNAFSTSKLL